MPHIFVTHNIFPNTYHLSHIRKLFSHLAEYLPMVCAEFLSSNDEGGSLEADDFSVTFLERGEYDVITHRLQIRVEAHSFPGRLANIDERTDKIREAIESALDNWKHCPFKALSFYVWVRLSPAGFSAGMLNPI